MKQYFQPFSLSAILTCSLSAQSFIYDFSEPPNNMTTSGVYGTRWQNGHGVAAVRDGILSMGRSEVYGTSSSAMFALTPDQSANHFEAAFDLRMWNAGRAQWDPTIIDLGDGVAFAVGIPNRGYVDDPSSNDYSEAGLRSGLSISFEAWDWINGARGAIRVRVDGQLVNSVPVNLRHMDPMNVSITYDSENGLHVSVAGGVTEDINIPSGSLNNFTLSSDYRVGFTSRTGGATGDLDVDNFSISGVIETAPIPTAVPEPSFFAAIAGCGLTAFSFYRRNSRR
jgi:hypothetical protein